MGIIQNLSILALRQVIDGALQAVGVSGGDAVANFLTERFTDHSQRLTAALQAANERAWKAMEIALAGESLWDRCKAVLARAEDQAFRDQVRAFLDISPLTRASAEHADTFRKALQELRAAQTRGSLTSGRLATGDLARQASAFARFNDPQALLDAEWKVVDQVAGELRETCPNLWKVLVARAKSGQRPSILAVAVRYYFRREVEMDQALFQGLSFAKLEALQDAQEKGFASLTAAMTQQGQRLEGMLGDLMDAVVGIKGVADEINIRVQGLEQQIQKLLEQLQLQNREVRPRDSMSVRSDIEQRRVRKLVSEYRALPEEQRLQRPGLGNQVGLLEVATGDLEAAEEDFKAAARALSDPKARAEAHHNAYRAALERQQWTAALDSLRQAVALDPGRFAPFPLERYEPQRILGAGGFGVVFLCKHRHLGSSIVVKSLLASELDREIADVFAEAKALEDLVHPAIIRLRDCDYADAARTRPYLVMDFFDGASLENHVAAQGLLSPEDLLAVAQPVAEALQAAHANGILHRDVKSGNLLLRREGGGWRVKLIDFGLAMRPATLEAKASTQSPQARTTTGMSIAGTLHYAAPEQMGQLPHTAVGAYSDVYGFGKTCYFALLGTPDPDDTEKKGLPEGWREILARCTGRTIANRFPDFAAVLACLAQLREGGVVKVPGVVAPPPPVPVVSPGPIEKPVTGGGEPPDRREGLEKVDPVRRLDIEPAPGKKSPAGPREHPKAAEVRVYIASLQQHDQLTPEHKKELFDQLYKLSRPALHRMAKELGLGKLTGLTCTDTHASLHQKIIDKHATNKAPVTPPPPPSKGSESLTQVPVDQPALLKARAEALAAEKGATIHTTNRQGKKRGGGWLRLELSDGKKAYPRGYQGVIDFLEGRCGNTRVYDSEDKLVMDRVLLETSGNKTTMRSQIPSVRLPDDMQVSRVIPFNNQRAGARLRLALLGSRP